MGVYVSCCYDVAGQSVFAESADGRRGEGEDEEGGREGREGKVYGGRRGRCTVEGGDADQAQGPPPSLTSLV